MRVSHPVTVISHQPSVGIGLRRLLRGLLLCLLLGVTGSMLSDQAVTAQASITGRERALRATVLLLVPDDQGELFASGSGTVMEAHKGYILTNYHVLGDEERGELYNEAGEAIVGVMPTNLRGAPILKYRANVVAGDPELDLALLRITGLVGTARRELPENLGLTAIEQANSDELMIGDPLYVLGYPNLGGNTLTMSQGLVSGFLDEDNNEVFEWIKTDAEVNHGNSGGLATNANWEFIGVPTAGVADVESAGKISFIRSGAVALQFYERTLVGNAATTESNGPRVQSVEFGSAVNRRSEIVRPGVHFQPGLTDLYAAFSYAGFSDGESFTTVWYHDGAEVNRERFAWEQGASGRSWVSLYDEEGLADGFYELALLLKERALYRGGVTLGAAPPVSCTFGPITFATGVDDEGEPTDAGERFGSVKTIYAFFTASDLRNGTPWGVVWSYEGRAVLRDETAWDAGSATTQWVSLTHPNGLPAGEFTLELSCAGEAVQRGAFSITARPPQPNRGVNVIGSIAESDNRRRRVVGALVLFLNPSVTVDAWVGTDFSEELIYASGTSNEAGEYQLDARVMPGEQYSIVVIHDDYEPISQDAYLIPSDADDPYELNVTLQRN
jgi:hypothetical protein